MTTGKSKDTVGFIGVDKMGSPVATDLSRRLGSKILLAETLLKSWADAEAKLGGAGDHTEIFRRLEG